MPYITNNGLATDHAYVNLTLATPLAPEEPLGAFIGEDPNGTWTLTITDDLAGDGGDVTWALDLFMLDCPIAAPVPPPNAQDLVAGASADPAAADPDAPVQVTGTILNDGPSSNGQGDLDFALPAGATATVLPTGCSATDGGVYCTVGGIGRGIVFERTIEVAFAEVGSQVVTVTATSPHTDPDPADNTASITVEVGDGAVPETPTIGTADLIDTAIEVSEHRFPGGGFAGAAAAFAVVARDDVFADALGSSVLLGNAPLLFTAGDDLDARTMDEIERLGVASVYLLGGEAALSQTVAEKVEGLGVEAVRLEGPSRIETAVAVADEAVALGIADGSEVALARAFGSEDGDETQAWADSITGGGYAARAGVPILLTATEELHPAVAAFIEANTTTDSTLLGGTAALSQDVEDAVPGAARVAGGNRFATAVAVAQDLMGVAPEGPRGYHIVNGEDPEGWGWGLVAAGLVAESGSPILLTGNDANPPETLEEVTDCGEQVALVGVGGPALVAPELLAELDAADAEACG